jgi:hypothetical protein
LPAFVQVSDGWLVQNKRYRSRHQDFFNAQKDETPDIAVEGLQEKSGGVLLSHKVSLAVPLALASLTSEFEMGSGVTSPL